MDGNSVDSVMNASFNSKDNTSEEVGGGGGNEAKAPVTTTIPLTRPTSIGLSGPRTGVYGVHPSQKRMKIIRMGGDQTQVYPTNDAIVAHYNPEEFTEINSVNYLQEYTQGVVFTRLQWGQGNPRKWSMKVLLSEWGDDLSNRSPGSRSVDETLDWLRNTMYPSDPATWTRNKSAFSLSGNSTNPTQQAPPPVMVILMAAPIIAYLIGMTIVRKKLQPISLKTVRAEVSLDLVEFLPASM